MSYRNYPYLALTEALSRKAANEALSEGFDFRGVDLTIIRDDMWAFLSMVPNNASILIEALKEGLFDGKAEMPNPNRPIESFFYCINMGDTPETSEFSKLATEWAEDWLSRMRAAFWRLEREHGTNKSRQWGFHCAAGIWRCYSIRSN